MISIPSQPWRMHRMRRMNIHRATSTNFKRPHAEPRQRLQAKRPRMRDIVTLMRSIAVVARRKTLAPVLVMAMVVLLTGAALTSRVAAAEFTPAQRAEIVRILREALKQDPSILRDAVDAMKDDDTRRDAEATRAAIKANHDLMVTRTDPVAGNPKGAVTIVEFYDTRCPYCRKIEPTMDRLLTQDHEVRLVYKDLPILGPPSVLAAHALLAAQQQNGYDRLRTALMQAPPDYTKDQILALARKLGLDDTRLSRDMDDPSIDTRIDANLKLAHVLGIDGTPALIIGDTLLPGAVELAELEKTIATARAAR
jgi:protein-disulfide isomerase